MIPVDEILAGILIILLVLRLINKYEIKFNKQITSIVVPGFICIVLGINFLITILGYNYNRKIYDKNHELLKLGKNMPQGELLYINEVPYKTSLFSWHTNSVNFNGDNLYYGFYLNKFYDKYYDMNSNIVVIVESE